MAAAAANVEDSIIAVLTKRTEGCYTDSLQKAVGCSMEIMVGALNKLLTNNRVTLFKDGAKLFYKLNDDPMAARMAGLTAEELLVLQCVQKAGDTGTWLKSLRLQTRLQTTQLKKLLNRLTVRRLVKSVKSVTAYRDVFLAYDVEPAKSVTGGKWYTDSKLDSAFIEQIREVVYQCLQRAPHTRVQLLSKVTQLGVSAVPLTPSDIQDILDTLVCDGYAEELPMLSAGPVVPSGLPSRGVGGGASGGAEAAAASSREDKVVYRVCRQPAHYNYVSEIPCGSCPVQHQCHPGGTVSPEKCVYMDKWLYEF